MALLCNDCEVKGKRKEIWCKHTDKPCVFLRYCSVSSHYYQTDGAARCKLRGVKDGKTEQ